MPSTKPRSPLTPTLARRPRVVFTTLRCERHRRARSAPGCSEPYEHPTRWSFQAAPERASSRSRRRPAIDPSARRAEAVEPEPPRKPRPGARSRSRSRSPSSATASRPSPSGTAPASAAPDKSPLLIRYSIACVTQVLAAMPPTGRQGPHQSCPDWLRQAVPERSHLAPAIPPSPKRFETASEGAPPPPSAKSRPLKCEMKDRVNAEVP